MARALRAWALGAALAAAASSYSCARDAFECSATRPCVEGAMCLPGGQCARVDRTCPSGLRFTSSARDPMGCAPATDAAIADVIDAGDGASDATLDVTDGADALDASNDADAPDGFDVLDASDATDATDEMDALDASDEGQPPFDALDAGDTSNAEDATGDASDAVDAPVDVPFGRCVVGAPRPLAPLSGMRAMSAVPTLEFSAASVLTSVELEIARERAFVSPIARHTILVSGGASTDPDVVRTSALARTPDGEDPLPPGRYFWRLRGVCADSTRTDYSATWQVRTLTSTDLAGPLRGAMTTLALPGGVDLNGDGYDDLVVGAPGLSRVYVYVGRATRTALITTPREIAPTPASAGFAFGASIANAGDVNGDGYGDVLIGHTTLIAGDTALPPGTSFSILFGGPIASWRVVDYAVPAATAQPANTRLGVSMDGVGDFLARDGYADVLIGSAAPATSGMSATAGLLFGGRTPFATTALIPPPGGTNGATGFSYTVAGTGPLRDDRLPAAVVSRRGQPQFPTQFDRMNPPRANLFGPLPAMPRGQLGAIIAPGGDLDGDLLGELVLADDRLDPTAPSAMSGIERVVVCSAASAASPQCVPVVVERAGSANQPHISIAHSGDLNGDGYDDLVTVMRNSARVTEVYVTLGTSARASLAMRTALCNRPGMAPHPTGFGLAATTAGDMDGDGFDDYAVSTGVASAAGSEGVPGVEVFFGRAATNVPALCTSAPPVTLPAPGAPSTLATALFGYAMR